MAFFTFSNAFYHLIYRAARGKVAAAAPQHATTLFFRAGGVPAPLPYRRYHARGPKNGVKKKHKISRSCRASRDCFRPTSGRKPRPGGGRDQGPTCSYTHSTTHIHSAVRRRCRVRACGYELYSTTYSTGRCTGASCRPLFCTHSRCDQMRASTTICDTHRTTSHPVQTKRQKTQTCVMRQVTKMATEQTYKRYSIHLQLVIRIQ